MPSKLRIKIGHLEFEYEGDAQFDAEAVKDLFTHLRGVVEAMPGSSTESHMPSAPPTAPQSDANSDTTELNYSPNTIAAKLGVTTGPDLTIAAAAHIQISNGKESFKRQELLETMKAAKSYYKANMSGNLTKILQTLVVAGRINELSNSEFSLSATEQSSMRARLAAES